MKNGNFLKDKKKRRRFIILLVVVLLVGFVVASSVISANTPMSLACVSVSTDDIAQTVDTSGVISASEYKTYFAPANIKLGKVNVNKGDIVNAGDVLYSYDSENLENIIKTAKLKRTEANAEYGDAIAKNDYIQNNYETASAKYEASKSSYADAEHLVQDYEYVIHKRRLELEEDGWSYFAIEGDEKIVEWEKGLAEAKSKMAEKKAERDGYEAEMKSNEASLMTDEKKTGISAACQLAQLSDAEALEALEASKDGVVADANGIITDVKVVDGSPLSAGAELITMACTNDLYVGISLSKSDLKKASEGQSVDITIDGKSYTGSLRKINRVAEKNESGKTIVKAEVSIDNPGTDIILGSEAKIKIHTAQATSTIVIPNELINYGNDGAFVFVVNNGLVEKRFINIGITSDMKSQIVGGLSEGELVAAENTDMLTEGMAVTGYTEE